MRRPSGTGILDLGSGNIAGATALNATAAGYQAQASGIASSAYGNSSTASAAQKLDHGLGSGERR
ncbi:MAG: hypothetical protein R3D30_10170 [Hyphomicrobiales bacterium]